MASFIARIIKAESRRRIRREHQSPQALVAHLRVAMNRPGMPLFLPRGVRHEELGAGPLRGEALRVAAPTQAVLYLHGGGYVAGHPRVYRNLCARLAKKLSADVFVPEYRLAPEHPFPAALDDALASYQALLERGFSPLQIVVMGDSAGGGLSLSLLLTLRDRGLPLPRCAVVFSPLADLRFVNASLRTNDASDDMLSEAMLTGGMGLYAGDHPASDPAVSPALGEYSGLCPLLVSVCEAECLRDDAYAVVERARAAGVPVELISRPDLVHVWPIFVPLMPEARADLAQIVRFVSTASR
ncbi:MAG TPA: alpha/beta hydrolase [Polyangiales bacterium]